MVITPHVLTGAVLATTTQSPVAAFLLGFISHFFLDMIPHMDPGVNSHEEAKNKLNEPWAFWLYAYVLCDFAVAISLFFWLFQRQPNFDIIAWGAFGGISVDLLDSSPITRFIKDLPVYRYFHWFHHTAHFQVHGKYRVWGILTQLALIGGVIWFFGRF